MSAHRELKEFVDFWRDKEGFEVHPTGNCEFRGHVAYASANGTVVDTTIDHEEVGDFANLSMTRRPGAELK